MSQKYTQKRERVTEEQCVKKAHGRRAKEPVDAATPREPRSCLSIAVHTILDLEEIPQTFPSRLSGKIPRARTCVFAHFKICRCSGWIGEINTACRYGEALISASQITSKCSLFFFSLSCSSSGDEANRYRHFQLPDLFVCGFRLMRLPSAPFLHPLLVFLSFAPWTAHTKNNNNNYTTKIVCKTTFYLFARTDRFLKPATGYCFTFLTIPRRRLAFFFQSSKVSFTGERSAGAV